MDNNRIRKTPAWIAAIAFGAIATASGAATLSIACDSVGNAARICKDGVEAWAQKTGNKVTLVTVSPASSDRLGLYQQLLAAESPAIDVFMIDAISTGILSNYLVDLSRPAGRAIDEHFPAIVQNNTVDGRLVAMPWFIDAGLLYYRQDLLQKYGEKPPETWEELAATARKIQDGERKAGNARMWGYVWQGKSYEGLTCNALEWLVSHNGGTIVDSAGKVTVNNSAAVAALKMARSWIGTISPKGVLSYGEEEARGVFQSGNAVFMRNWPYAWATANSADSPVKGKVGAMPLPKGGANGRHAATLGGQQLAVSKFSRNADAAIDLVLYLTGKEEQKRRALAGSYNPTIRSLYSDRDILAANPFQGRLYDTFVNATARPSAVTRARYNQVSSEFWNTVFTVIGEGSEPADSLKRLDVKLRRISVHGTWQ
ncbi:ABC transporter substrate-binding protein [Herbaspirillum sp. HC18]|nr:ABC transporter substrate-binding protein [Herbaspirillum sp. HC18]